MWQPTEGNPSSLVLPFQIFQHAAMKHQVPCFISNNLKRVFTMRSIGPPITEIQLGG